MSLVGGRDATGWKKSRPLLATGKWPRQGVQTDVFIFTHRCVSVFAHLLRMHPSEEKQ